MSNKGKSQGRPALMLMRFYIILAPWRPPLAVDFPTSPKRAIAERRSSVAGCSGARLASRRSSPLARFASFHDVSQSALARYE